MKWFLVLGVLALFAVRFALAALNVTGIKSEVDALPTLSTSNELNAVNFVNPTIKIAKEHGCTVLPETLTVNVGPAETSETGQKLTTQAVDIAFKCERQGPFFVQQQVSIEVATRGMASRGATTSHYPEEQ